MKDFNCTKLPIAVDVDILFDGNHFICYEDALKYIHDRIEKLEDQ